MAQVTLRTYLYSNPIAKVQPPAKRVKAPIKYLFVYGTLRKGSWNYGSEIPRSMKLEEEARIHGALFVHPSHHIPIVVIGQDLSLLERADPIESSYVHGELLSLPDSDSESRELFRRLDFLEGFDERDAERGTYRRLQVDVYRADASTVSAWAYVATPKEYKGLGNSAPYLPLGDWLRAPWVEPSGLPFNDSAQMQKKLDLLARRGRITLSPEIDGSITTIIGQFFAKEDLEGARNALNRAFAHEAWGKELPALVVEWTKRYFAEPKFLASYRDWDKAVREGVSLLQASLEALTYFPSQARELVELLDELIDFSHPESTDSHRRDFLKIAWQLLQTPKLKRKPIVKYIEKWWANLKTSKDMSTDLLRAYVEILLSLTKNIQLKKRRQLIALDLLALLQSTKTKNDAKCIIFDGVSQVAEQLPFALRQKYLSVLKKELLGAFDSAYKRKVGRAILHFSRANKLSEAVPHMLNVGDESFLAIADDVQKKRVSPETFFPSLLRSSNPSISEAAYVALNAAGEEAVHFAVRDLHLRQKTEALIFLEGILWAAHGVRFEKTKERIRRVVDFYRQKSRELDSQDKAIFTLRKGIEIEWWPKGYYSIERTDSSHPLTGALQAFKLFTTAEGYGEFASFPSRRIDAQVHLFELIRRLGLFSPHYSQSLHINFGLPFDLPWYLAPSPYQQPEADEAPTGPNEHPALYEALSLLWLPLGIQHMSNRRWDNMRRPEDPVLSIQQPFLFHHENVLGGDQARFEIRPFEISAAWGRKDFAALLTATHHLTVALFWKELDFTRGTDKTHAQFSELGYIWENYANLMGRLLANAGFQVPNYFTNRTADELSLMEFHGKAKSYRHQHPEFLNRLQHALSSTVKKIDRLVGIPSDFSLSMPPPLFSNPKTFLI